LAVHIVKRYNKFSRVKFSQRKEIEKKSICDTFIPEFMRTTWDSRDVSITKEKARNTLYSTKSIEKIEINAKNTFAYIKNI